MGLFSLQEFPDEVAAVKEKKPWWNFWCEQGGSLVRVGDFLILAIDNDALC
ncbi:hypothetical protein [Bacillus toyonensis]|uniref:hypothetical protein n=1 Tax=Bacillus toyonensis TaxID=155322 RepID=UPI0015D4AA81|nr:hypothetical protein [Bacillus toyonensis]